MARAVEQPAFRTARLLVRPFRLDDQADLHGIFTNRDAMRYWDDVHVSREETRAFVQGTMEAPASKACDFVLERDGAVIGKAGMWNAPEIGFILDPAHWRQGLMTEALDVVIPHLFSTYPFPVLMADVDPENAGSLGLLRKLGFRETGTRNNTIKIAGQWCDSVDLALSRAEWAARTA